MKLTMNVGDLVAAMNTCAMIADGASNIDALRATKFDASGGIATLSATNTFEWVKSKVKCEGDGKFIADTQFILTKLKTLKAASDLAIDIDEKHVTLSSGKTKWKVPTLLDVIPNDEFDMGEPVKFGPDFIKAIVKVSGAADIGDTREYLKCVYIDENRAVATDGKEIRISEFEGASPVKIMMPLGFVRKVAASFTGDIEYFANDAAVMISDGQTSIRTRLVEGQYPDYQRILLGAVQSGINKCSVDSDDFVSAVRMASAIGKTGEKSTAHINSQLQFRQDGITIIARNPVGEESFAECSCDRENGEDVDIGLNGEWVVSNAVALDCDRFDIHYGTEQSIVTFKHGKDTFMIMPMRFK